MATPVYITVADAGNNTWQLVISATDDTDKGLMDEGIAPQWTINDATKKQANNQAEMIAETLRIFGAAVILRKFK